ncbi:GNAT family N-acetyltransferase [Microbulbifer taiwanensis]|uniref:GNAT family N-acetyltransferase n=2 Tax=Microbulbifer taiwanensis TaxID=986746 RepID=A0ABW1YRS8_9GAMM
MQISTKRFLLRYFEDAEVSAFVAYHADPRSHEFYGIEHRDPEHARKLLKLFKDWAEEVPRLNYQLAIIRRDVTQPLIGCCGLRTGESEPGRAELGIELAPDFWGRYRYALEIIQALVEFGFNKLGLREIYGGTVSENRRIARLAESLGATAEVKPGPAWMVERGWYQVEWRISRAQWRAPQLSAGR